MASAPLPPRVRFGSGWLRPGNCRGFCKRNARAERSAPRGSPPRRRCLARGKGSCSRHAGRAGGRMRQIGRMPGRLARMLEPAWAGGRRHIFADSCVCGLPAALVLEAEGAGVCESPVHRDVLSARSSQPFGHAPPQCRNRRKCGAAPFSSAPAPPCCPPCVRRSLRIEAASARFMAWLLFVVHWGSRYSEWRKAVR